MVVCTALQHILIKFVVVSLPMHGVKFESSHALVTKTKSTCNISDFISDFL